MRVSLIPGNRTDRCPYECDVFLDGQPIKYCQEADDEEGYILVFRKIEDRLDMKNLVRLEGKVTLDFGECHHIVKTAP